MKISRNWLQTFFDKPLPDAQALSEALTFHAFEIESIEKRGRPTSNHQDDFILDVKITPNRGHDCLSHRSIAKELSAILNVPMKEDPLRVPVSLEPKTEAVSVSIEDSKLCARYIAGHIRGVKVGPSPEWLRGHLEAIGQCSINNVVDAANYVMFNIGQPLHAFDASKLMDHESRFAIQVRKARKGERMTALDDKEYQLSESMLVITDGNADIPIGIAGVKGGKPAGVTEATRDIIIESANFDGVSVRRTASALKLRTDASERFQQVISPELAGYGMRSAVELILELAGGELVGFADQYPNPVKTSPVSVSAAFVNKVLGTKISDKEVEDVLKRLGFVYMRQGDTLTVDVPFERLDILIPEDLVEEVGRIIGYDKIPAVELSQFPKKPEVNNNFHTAEHAREELIAKGYSEVFTSVFADKGERAVLNKVGGERPYLRSTLVDRLKEAFEKNSLNKDVLGLSEIRLFEIGTIWKDGKEVMMLGTADSSVVREEPLQISGDRISRYEELPVSTTERYESFSKFPFIVRDIALWTSAGTKSNDVLKVVRAQAGELLVRSELFDTFEKEGKLSLAFRLVFQSFGKTLTDAEVNGVMGKVNSAVAKKGWEVR